MIRLWQLCIVLAVGLMALSAQATPPNIITNAKYIEPTTRYDHGILGDAVEWGALELTVDTCIDCEIKSIRKFIIRLPENRVFEDIAPRLVELTDEAGPGVMVVETDLELGARLAIYYESGVLAATPFIGRSHRWLAPIGAADFDGDGYIEYAYVDRPHLAKTIKVWRLIEGEFLQVAERAGFTNHNIGDGVIAGGVRDCGAGPEMIVADGNWKNVVAVTLIDNRLDAVSIGPFQGHKSLRKALLCKS